MGERRHFLVHWAVWDTQVNLPVVYLMDVEDSGKKPLPNDAYRWPQVQQALMAQSVGGLKLVTIATGFDKDFEGLHPKRLRRIILGPMYSASFTLQSGPISKVLDGAKAPEGEDWALVWTVEDLVSDREEEVKDGWFSTATRQVYKLDPVAGAELGATRQDRMIILPEKPYQVLVEQNPRGLAGAAEVRRGGRRAVDSDVVIWGTPGALPRTPGYFQTENEGFMTTRDTMELKEEVIRAQYEAALGMVLGFDHAPRLAKALVTAPVAERSSGVGARPTFRSTVPGMATRSTARPGGVRLSERVEALGDGLVTPVQAAVLNALRRSLAIALAMGETFSAQSGLAELKKANLEGRVPEPKRVEFGELLQGEALVVLFTFANALAYLIAPHVGPGTVELGRGGGGADRQCTAGLAGGVVGAGSGYRGAGDG